MELAYEGDVTQKNYSSAALVLKSALSAFKLPEGINTYWSQEEQAPVAEINRAKLSGVESELAERICLENDFMVEFKP